MAVLFAWQIFIAGPQIEKQCAAQQAQQQQEAAAAAGSRRAAPGRGGATAPATGTGATTGDPGQPGAAGGGEPRGSAAANRRASRSRPRAHRLDQPDAAAASTTSVAERLPRDGRPAGARPSRCSRRRARRMPITPNSAGSAPPAPTPDCPARTRSGPPEGAGPLTPSSPVNADLGQRRRAWSSTAPSRSTTTIMFTVTDDVTNTGASRSDAVPLSA